MDRGKGGGGSRSIPACEGGGKASYKGREGRRAWGNMSLDRVKPEVVWHNTEGGD